MPPDRSRDIHRGRFIPLVIAMALGAACAIAGLTLALRPELVAAAASFAASAWPALAGSAFVPVAVVAVLAEIEPDVAPTRRSTTDDPDGPSFGDGEWLDGPATARVR